MYREIREVCQVRLGHSFRGKIENDQAGFTHIIHPRNITREGILDFYQTEPDKTNIEPQHPLLDGEVLFVNKGRFTAAVFHGNEEVWTVPSSVLVLTIKSKNLLPEYLALYLNSPVGQNALKQMVELSTVPFMSRQNLMRFEILIPHFGKQLKLIELSNTIRILGQKQNRKIELVYQLLHSELG